MKNQQQIAVEKFNNNVKAKVPQTQCAQSDNTEIIIFLTQVRPENPHLKENLAFVLFLYNYLQDRPKYSLLN